MPLLPPQALDVLLQGGQVLLPGPAAEPALRPGLGLVLQRGHALGQEAPGSLRKSKRAVWRTFFSVSFCPLRCKPPARPTWTCRPSRSSWPPSAGRPGTARTGSCRAAWKCLRNGISRIRRFLQLSFLKKSECSYPLDPLMIRTHNTQNKRCFMVGKLSYKCRRLEMSFANHSAIVCPMQRRPLLVKRE